MSPDRWAAVPLLAPARVSVEVLQSVDASGLGSPLVLEVARVP